MALGGLHRNPARLGKSIDSGVATEASPAATFDASEWHLSFVMNGWAVDMADARLD